MAENKRAVIPNFRSLDELVEFFDTRDLGDYLEQMPEARFDVDIQATRYLFLLDADVAVKLGEIAKAKSVSSETLLNAWLREKLAEAESAAA